MSESTLAEVVENLASRGVGVDLRPTIREGIGDRWWYGYIAALDARWRAELTAALAAVAGDDDA